MSLPLLPSVGLSGLVLLGSLWTLWKGQRWLWSLRAAQVLPGHMTQSMPEEHSRQVVGFLVSTVGLLVLGSVGLFMAHLSKLPSVGTQPLGLILMILLGGSSLSLLVLAVLGHYRNPAAWKKVSGVMQAAGVALIWSWCAFGLLGWGVTLSHGSSMEPSLPDGLSLGVVDLKAYRATPPLVGDIITFRGTEGWGRGAYNKRVVGGPGDAFQYAFDQVWKNGRPLVTCSDQGCFARPSTNVVYQVRGKVWGLPKGWGLKPPSMVAEDHFFVLGDNLAVSGDSRFFGAIPRYAVEGKVVATIGLNGYRRVDNT